ncbi:hypothetical protein [Motiliproteus sp. MSK22-1]|uniref:hypothetical protein n=1 Tax=Motiliproteus sp. MSK22-1 TaxID=1897630 RepID=UPI00097658F2|nr:hypothetical protein [Motiliproteus sp. MSK22-1]OMH25754.1 hypothetical protein BGP75_24820 [Motiliproteus sp. MSK22-1]
MGFTYSREWENELVSLYQNADSEEDDEKIYALLERVDRYDDIRTARALFKCLKIEIEGIDQAAINILGAMDYVLYYEAVFQTISTYSDSELADAVSLLDWPGGTLSLQDLESNVFIFIDNNLDINRMKKLVHEIEETDYHEEQPHMYFYNYFKHKIAEKSHD